MVEVWGKWQNGAMSLNIKNEEAHRMAKEMAEATGESMTKAVTLSLIHTSEPTRPY